MYRDPHSPSPLRLPVLVALVVWPLAACTAKIKTNPEGARKSDSASTSGSASGEGYLDANITGVVVGVNDDGIALRRYTDAAALATFETPVIDAKIVILRVLNANNDYERLAVTKSDGVGRYSATLLDVSPSDVLLVVAFKNDVSFGQTLVPIGAALTASAELRLADSKTLNLEVKIARVETVTASVLFRKDIDLATIKKVELDSVSKAVEENLAVLDAKGIIVSATDAATQILDSKAFVDQLRVALPTADLTAERDPAVLASVDFSLPKAAPVEDVKVRGRGDSPAMPGEPSLGQSTGESTVSVDLSWKAGTGSATRSVIAYAPGAVGPENCASGTVIDAKTIGDAVAYKVTGLTPGMQYSFRICSITGNASPLMSAGIVVTTRTLQSTPGQASAPLAEALANAVTLSWTAGTGSTAGYKIAYKTGPTAPADCQSDTVIAASSVAGATTYQVLGLASNTQYSFRICSVNSDRIADVASGVTITKTTLLAAPGEPSAPSAVADSTAAITLSWTAGSGTTSGHVISYAVGATAPLNCSVGTVVSAATIGGASVYQVTGLAPGTQYSFRICAINGNPIPDKSSGVTVTKTTLQTPPGQASSPNATADSDVAVTLSWTAGTGTTVGHKIAYKSGTIAPASCQVDTVISAATVAAASSYQVTGLAANTQYTFRICSVNNAGDVATGVTSTATTLLAAPGNPSSASATADSTTAITLNWTAGTGTTSGHIIAYAAGATAPATCSSGTVINAATVAASVSYQITPLSAGTQYSFRICSVNSNPTPNKSSGVTLTKSTLQSPPGAASSPSSVADSSVAITVSWTAGTGTTSGHKIAYKSGATAPTDCQTDTVIAAATIGAATSRQISGLTPNTQYSFRICSVNSNATPNIDAGVTTAATTLIAAPGEPSSASSVADSTVAITVSWTAGTGTASGHIIAYTTGVTAPASCALGTVINAATIASAVSYQVTGLAAGTQYSFRICSVNSNPTPDKSTGITLTKSTLQAAPGQASGLTATADSTVAITLNWTAGTGTTSGHKIAYKAGATAPADCQSDTIIAAATVASATSYQITSLAAASQYSFRVCSVNSNATPDVASGVTVTKSTKQAAPGDASAPSATVLSASSIQLSWAAGTGTTAAYAIAYTSGGTAPSTCSSGTPIAATTVGSSTSYTVAGLTGATQYSFRICSANGDTPPTLATGVTVSGTTQTQAASVCDTGDVNSTCTVTSNKTVSNGSSIAGSGTLIINSGVTVSAAAGNAFTIDMGTVTVNGTIAGNLTYLGATTLTVASGASINADSKGQLGVTGSAGLGAGAGSYHFASGGGAGYGGAGARGDMDGDQVGGLGGAAYGAASAAQPTAYGSSGGAGNSTAIGGNGGGAIHIVVSGVLTVAGRISANGGIGIAGGPYGAGGGSGGSLWIDAGTIAGTGSIESKGGDGGAGTYDGGGGGGGRIALYLSNKFVGTVSVAGGLHAAPAVQALGSAEDGGLYIGRLSNFCDTGDLDSGCTISSKTVLDDGRTLSGTNNLTVTSTGSVYQPGSGTGPTISIGGDLTVQGSGVLSAKTFAALSAHDVAINASGQLTGAITSLTANSLNVAGTLTGDIASAKVPTVTVSGTISGNVRAFVATSFEITGTGVVKADGIGYKPVFYAAGTGPGGAPWNSQGAGGGGNGGAGGLGSTPYATSGVGGAAVGTAAQPGMGSAGGAGNYSIGGWGGGLVKLIVRGTLTIDGRISADGTAGMNLMSSAGGGAGGGVWLDATTFAGSGIVRAKGGNGGVTTAFNGYNGGGGGGGRLAFYYATGNFSGTTSVAGGINGGDFATDGGVGSIYNSQFNVDHNRLFVTSVGYTGDVTVTTADADCESLADAAGYPASSNWKALLSTAGASAASRVSQATVIVNPYGDVVTVGALWSGTLANAVRYTETNADAATTGVWTGTQSNGTAAASKCTDWSTTSGTGGVGVANAADAKWLVATTPTANCTSSYRLYCLSQP